MGVSRRRTTIHIHPHKSRFSVTFASRLSPKTTPCRCVPHTTRNSRVCQSALLGGLCIRAGCLGDRQLSLRLAISVARRCPLSLLVSLLHLATRRAIRLHCLSRAAAPSPFEVGFQEATCVRLR